MKKELLPVKFDAIPQGVYVGFWMRVAAKLLDFIVMLPIVGLTLYVASISVSAYQWSLIPGLLFGLAFEVVLLKLYGATPGKMMLGIKVIKNNGDDVDWKSSFYRYSVEFFIAALGIYVTYLTLSMVDSGMYDSYSWWNKSACLAAVNPFPIKMQSWVSMGWTLIGAIVLVSNSRKQSTHDFIAGTVVIKAVTLEKVREIVNKEENEVNEKM